jgi:hypothetical protein
MNSVPEFRPEFCLTIPFQNSVPRFRFKIPPQDSASKFRPNSIAYFVPILPRIRPVSAWNLAGIRAKSKWFNTCIFEREFKFLGGICHLIPPHFRAENFIQVVIFKWGVEYG